jgi:hypothetical protein
MSQIRKYALPFKAILAIDFDHTICMSDYPELGMQRTGAGVIMRKLIQGGYGIVINTCREGLALANAILWMENNNIPYHYLNCNFPHLIEEYGADCRKISADLYIDDKCLTGLPNWGEIYKLINLKFA